MRISLRALHAVLLHKTVPIRATLLVLAEMFGTIRRFLSDYLSSKVEIKWDWDEEDGHHREEEECPLIAHPKEHLPRDWDLRQSEAKPRMGKKKMEEADRGAVRWVL